METFIQVPFLDSPNSIPTNIQYLTFEDYESNINTIETNAGLFVGGETDFDVSFSESNAGEISLSIANIGNNIAYSVKVSVPKQAGYSTTGSSSTIVGNLEKGDYTITSFNVINTQAAGTNSEDSSSAGKATAAPSGNKSAVTRSAGSGTDPTMKVQIEYTDAKGERITVQKDVPV
ncbi:hypothetical protein [Methanosarcina sp. 2.H.A.1B.4]|uniref:hypothetical protein n=1 Tax=Methanosarcina sp. 2.H.A.1B.4 TaxID=1483600 RepID=UPI000ABBDA84|nr:hypothetical protein [Methanosarcina sp. 2.H.A.1B.4]